MYRRGTNLLSDHTAFSSSSGERLQTFRVWYVLDSKLRADEINWVCFFWIPHSFGRNQYSLWSQRHYVCSNYRRITWSNIFRRERTVPEAEQLTDSCVQNLSRWVYIVRAQVVYRLRSFQYAYTVKTAYPPCCEQSHTELGTKKASPFLHSEL